MSTWSVLVVDDHALYRDAVVLFLEGTGAYEVVGTAVDGQDALEKAQVLQPDIVLIDLQMPVRSGLETLPDLRRLLPDAGIVAVSIREGPATRYEACAAGADVFVAKRVAPDELIPALARLTGRVGDQVGGHGRPRSVVSSDS